MNLSAANLKVINQQKSIVSSDSTWPVLLKQGELKWHCYQSLVGGQTGKKKTSRLQIFIINMSLMQYGSEDRVYQKIGVRFSIIS